MAQGEGGRMKITDQEIVEMEMDAEDQIEMNGTYDIDGEDFYALLHRLECAETYAEFRLDFPSGHDGELERLEAWRKSKGDHIGDINEMVKEKGDK
jgi:hypothetical protein